MFNSTYTDPNIYSRECEFLQDVARISGSFHEPLHFMHSGSSDPPIALNNPNYPRSMTLGSTFDRKSNSFGDLN